MKKVSIVVPVYNEINTIDVILEKIENAPFCNLEKEIILVDDMSTDGTREHLKELEEKYKTDDPIFGAMYMTPSGTLIDCSMFPNGHADVSAWLHEQGLEIDYQSGEASKLLYLKGWLRLNTKVGYVEQSDRAITVRQRRRIAEIFGEGVET